MTNQEIKNKTQNQEDSLKLRIKEIEETIKYVDLIIEWADTCVELNDVYVDWTVIEDMLNQM